MMSFFYFYLVLIVPRRPTKKFVLFQWYVLLSCFGLELLRRQSSQFCSHAVIYVQVPAIAKSRPQTHWYCSHSCLLQVQAGASDASAGVCAQSTVAFEQFETYSLLLSRPKALWQVYPNRIMEQCLHKCIHKVDWAGCPAKGKWEDKEESHCSPFNYQCKSLKLTLL